jgi:cytochrome c-type biogenesis protein CcmH/NrfG
MPSSPAAPHQPAATNDRAPARHAPRAQPEVDPPRPDDSSDELVRAAEDRLGAGHTEEACLLGQAAAEAHPKSPAAWQFLGRCRMRHGEGEAARAAFRRYLELAPRAPDAIFVRAIVEESR